MHFHDHLGDNTWLLASVGGLALVISQACANGNTHQGAGETGVTGGATSNQGGAVSTGGSGATSSQGGSTVNASTDTTGGVGQGGTSNGLGGSNDGGNPATGGQTVAAGGGDVGGNPATGGQSPVTNTGGSATGGANTGGMATGGTPGTNCQTSLDCVTAPNSQTICDTTTHSCVQCVLPADCGDCSTPGTCYDCTLNKCVAYDSCATSTDCPNGRACDTTRGRCVDCTVDTDCTTGQKCVAQTCRIGCSSDNACTPSGQLCNTTAGYCVQCNSVLKCTTAGLVCDPTGLCSPPVCNSGDKSCVNNGVASCLADGSGFGTPLPCPANSTCKAAAGTVACYGDGGDGGAVDYCAVGGNPCQEIPRFTGTQVVDGLGDEFCDIPSVQFDAADAAKVIIYNSTPPEVATVRVAWSSAALSVFVDVQDASVQTVSMADPTQQISRIYQGDSIELMISSSNNVTGLTGTDTNALHVTIPAAGPAVSVKTSDVNGASQGAYTTLDTSEYAQTMTATGYAIEMRLPWPGSAPSAGTTVRFDMALNSADKNFTSVDNMRDGQLIYYLGTVSGTTTCQGTGGDGTVPFCDDRTWCSTPVQGP